MEVRPLAARLCKRQSLALRPCSVLLSQTPPPGQHALQACLSITSSAPPAGGCRGSAAAAATAAFHFPRPHLRRQRRRYSHRPCAQQPAVAATAVPEAAAELDAAGREQWAAASALVQQRCAVDAEEADAALLKAFGWKGQGFWRQVRRRVDDGAIFLLRTRPQSLTAAASVTVHLALVLHPLSSLPAGARQAGALPHASGCCARLPGRSWHWGAGGPGRPGVHLPRGAGAAGGAHAGECAGGAGLRGPLGCGDRGASGHSRWATLQHAQFCKATLVLLLLLLCCRCCCCRCRPCSRTLLNVQHLGCSGLASCAGAEGQVVHEGQRAGQHAEAQAQGGLGLRAGQGLSQAGSSQLA